MLSRDDKPIISDLTSASVPLWDLLASDNRADGLRWLNKTCLLHQLFPCWSGNATRRTLRLNAVEQIQAGSWREGLSPEVISLIEDIHNVVIDGRLNGWALTALATLLAGGDTENQYFWSKMVRRNMFELGATEAEIIWVEQVVIDYRRAVQFLRGETEEAVLTPQQAVTILSTMKVGGEDSPEDLAAAANRVNQALGKESNPLDRE